MSQDKEQVMIPPSIKIPLPGDYVLSYGALFLSVDKLVDWDRQGAADNQARDENGVPLWGIKGPAQDPAAGKFGRSNETKVKIASEHQPVPPAGIELPGGI